MRIKFLGQGSIPYLYIITHIILSIFLPEVTFAQRIDKSTDILFREKTVMIGGDSKLIEENASSMILETKGETWISIPFMIAESGFYRLTVVKDGGGLWDALIDGEKYEQLTNISLELNGKNVMPYPIYFDKGQHSIIFYSDNNIHTINKWSSLKIDKLLNQPSKYIDTRKYWVMVNEYSKILEIGDMFAGSYINVNIARDMALFSKNGYQFISYYHPSGYLVVGRRKFDSTYFEKYWIPINGNKAPITPIPSMDFSLSDPHHFIAMQMDGDGYIHLAFGHHNNKLKYLRSKYPYEISKWNIPERYMVNEDDEKRVTYVRFIRLKSGNLLAAYRSGSAGRGYSRLLIYDINTKKWSKLHSPFITDYGKSSPYLWRPVVSPDGTIHLAWTWRLSKFDDLETREMKKRHFSGFSNKDISYAKSFNEAKTWLSSDNSKYEIPIERRGDDNHRAEVIENIPMGESFFNHYGSDYDTKGNPHFTYTRWDNAVDRIPQQWHLYCNGNLWKSKSITNYSNRFNWTRPQQNGRASTYLSRPSILVAKDDAAIIISRSEEFNNIVELYISNDPNYETWKRFIAYGGSVGGWEPQMDLDLWHTFNKLDLLLLGVTDKVIKRYYYKKPLVKIRRWLKNILLKLQYLLKKEERDIYNYYSNDRNVRVMRIDENLKEDTGYILEIDYQDIKKYLFSDN